jgi:hypothetical protein
VRLALRDSRVDGQRASVDDDPGKGMARSHKKKKKEEGRVQVHAQPPSSGGINEAATGVVVREIH